MRENLGADDKQLGNLQKCVPCCDLGFMSRMMGQWSRHVCLSEQELTLTHSHGDKQKSRLIFDKNESFLPAAPVFWEF